MIRLWLSRDTQIPVQEQLSAQLVLGILSRRLKPGERLPSVRALARQLKLHPNTVSAVYGTLVDRGWVNRRRGSGVYVKRLDLPASDSSADAFARSCLDEGLARGFSLDLLSQAFAKIIREAVPLRLLVVDRDLHLARVLAAEIGEALGCVVPFASECDAQRMLASNSCVLVTETSLRSMHFVEALEHRTIRLNSMQDLLIGRQRPPGPALIAVVSSSASILRWASTLLSALGFSADSVLLRDPAQADWHEGLGACDVVAGDVLVASGLAQHSNCSPLTFRLVSPDFLSELRLLMKNDGTGPAT